ncbi:MAG: hypothetical protein QOF51_2134 [Chloroflexota bacterium]|jgi:hypothetical protein|nr:hypothetical protein [Chloroflexota bacterium]
MRLVKVTMPAGCGAEVAALALKLGIGEVAVHQVYVYGPNVPKDVLDVAVSTDEARKFIDALLDAPFYEPHQYALEVREPRTIGAHEGARGITWPLVRPPTDILEELWQFSHITFSFVLRVLLAGLILCYGMVQANLLLMIGGLMFLPLLPALLSVSFGMWVRDWQLVGRGLLALLLATCLVLVSGIVVAHLTPPPLEFTQFASPLVGFLLSLVVGTAAGLATVDDAGHRELIGLASASQIALVPAWLGLSLVFGFEPATAIERLRSLGINAATIVATGMAVYVLVGIRASTLQRFAGRTASQG